MTLHPIDFQVNMQSTLEVAKSESIKIAQHDFNNMSVDQKIKDEHTQLITALPESQGLEASNEKKSESDSFVFSDSSKKNKNHSKNNSPSEVKKKENLNESKINTELENDSNHHISYLA